MLILLVRGDKPAVVCGMGVPHGEGLAMHAGLESCAAVGAMTAVAVSDLTYIDTLSSPLLEGVYGKTIEIAAHLGVHYATVSRRLNSWSDLSNIVALQGLTIEFLREFGGATKVFFALS